jgi:hypothetical protein
LVLAEQSPLDEVADDVLDGKVGFLDVLSVVTRDTDGDFGPS